MSKIIRRIFHLDLPRDRSAFLWGPRKVGKSYWIAHHLRDATVIDLLKTDVFAEYAARPALLRERYQQHQGLLVIDEVQKIPALLDEVHWLIENRGQSFLLTGSSARKLRHGHANLLGGRAWRKTMLPLSYQEVSGLDLDRIMVSGLLPPHYLASHPLEDIRAYVADYLKEEIAAEASIQQIPSFQEFLRFAAISSSELINYTNMAREVGISQRTVRTYFNILEDTYIGFRIPPWRAKAKRRLVTAEKFYLFDVGVTNYLARRHPCVGGADFGKAFEQYMLMELRAYQAYRNPELPITFWRTSAGQEVDFIIGDMELAIEIKGTHRVHAADVRSLKSLLEEHRVKRRVVVCLESEPRQVSHEITIIPWQKFLEQLWSGTLC